LASLPVRIAGVVPKGSAPGQLDLPRWSEHGRVAPFVAYALAAAEGALSDAGWRPRDARERERTGVCIGAGMGHIADVADAGVLLAGGRGRRVSPFFVPRILVNMAAGHVSMAHGLRGPLGAPCTACASGAAALAEAARAIRHGEADAMLAGGTEACVGDVALWGFARAKALAGAVGAAPGHEVDASAASRPFDAARAGFVLAEGAGVLLLEELGAARARGARIYAELRGAGAAADAHHVTAPPRDGAGAKAAMRAALRAAGLRPAHIGYINAHATGTPLGDDIEADAIASVFGQTDADADAFGDDDSDADASSSVVAVSSTKGAMGHLLGAAGAVEAAVCCLALAERVAPHTRNLTHPAAGDLASHGARGVRLLAGAPEALPRLRAALSNSFGFGGTNTALCFAQPPSDDEPA
jgi:3-oxoacyl-[acyl-carrier-protein] synthase II